MLTTLAAWIHANCPAGVVQKVVLDSALRAEQQRHDYHVAIGGRLTKSGQPYLVQCYGGNLFVFALANEQLRHYGISEIQTRFFDDYQRPVLAADPTLILEGFEVEGADDVDWFKPIRGRCRYRSETRLPENLCVRIELIPLLVSAPNQVCRLGLFCYPWLPPGMATIEFQLSPISRPAASSKFLTPQTAAVFLSVCISPKARQRQEPEPISDTLGALVTFR